MTATTVPGSTACAGAAFMTSIDIEVTTPTAIVANLLRGISCALLGDGGAGRPTGSPDAHPRVHSRAARFGRPTPPDHGTFRASNPTIEGAEPAASTTCPTVLCDR
ncbi:hypothetical protein KRMM14A1259_26930 [Krasilnikovia sp. MM14-A1259]